MTGKRDFRELRFIVCCMHRMEQCKKEFARRSHLLHVKRKRLALDECPQQARLAHSLRSEDQHGFRSLAWFRRRPVLFAFDATQIFKSRLVMGRGAHFCLSSLLRFFCFAAEQDQMSAETSRSNRLIFSIADSTAGVPSSFTFRARSSACSAMRLTSCSNLRISTSRRPRLSKCD